MKKLLHVAMLGLLVPLLTACPGSGVEPEPVSAYQPLLMSRQQLETSIALKAPQPIYAPGKIYLFGNHIFINEKYKGVHVINNQDPKNPEQVAFIQVPGNIDFAVKNQVLYVDNAVDLVAIDLSDLNNIEVTQRIKNVFPELSAPDGFNTYDRANVPDDAVVVGWTKKKN
ncbi:MAG: hypothetical protein LPK19_07800 [Hymenobacteraceae bacterium]|nr:hypothetical protein [Hymenobacteraceae bacterium]MDX5396116.1 hypothetical protein [Hymenobacteraceae bacterium]MDX5512177.1 hypothetical protein [Hymenobacteraceae bacterium]